MGLKKCFEIQTRIKAHMLGTVFYCYIDNELNIFVLNEDKINLNRITDGKVIQFVLDDNVVP